ncbi:MAG: TCP-1/cpn60 chaperonin family protein, partial [Thermoanaerobaculia bacterium]
GRAKRVLITSEKTTIIEGGGSSRDIKAREAEIRRELEDTTSEYDREKLQERLAKLVGGVAVVKVGAATESEMKERKNRFEGALNATRSAVEEGILPGGGVALLRIAGQLKPRERSLAEEEVGVECLRKALEAPIRQLAQNAGREPAEVIWGLREAKPTMGFDLIKGEYCDMVKQGIIDPTKVTRTALENAISVATLLLTADAVVSSLPKKEEPAGHHHHHDDMDDEGGMGDF